MLQLDTGNYFSYDMIGEFRSDGSWIHPRRVIESFELILVLAGTVHIAEDNTEYSLGRNQLLLLEPGREHYGFRTVSELTMFYWFHFLTDLRLPLKTYTGEDVYEIKQLLKRLLHIANTPGYSQAARDASAYLIFEELLRLARSESHARPTLISNITEYIRLHLKEGVTVSEIARQFDYNSDYIGKLFKKVYGVGLKEYIDLEKMKLARDLLLSTSLNVKQISHELGYQEENLFVKFFLYHEKISPTAFRGKYYNTHINNK